MEFWPDISSPVKHFMNRVFVVFPQLYDYEYSCNALVQPSALMSATLTFAHKTLSTRCIARNTHPNCTGYV